MHFSTLLLPLAASGLVSAQTYGASCTVKSIADFTKAVYRPSGVSFCNAYLSVPTRTVTSSGRTTVTKTSTITSVVRKTTTVGAPVKNNFAVAGAIDEDDIPVSIQTFPNAPDGPATVPPSDIPAAPTPLAERDEAAVLEARAPKNTPTKFRSLQAGQITSVCRCLTTRPTITSRPGGTSTKVVSKTVTKTSTITVYPATPTLFYLKVNPVSNTTVDNTWLFVGGEQATFVSDRAARSRFIITANTGRLVSQSNGWVANSSPDLTYSTLFFDSPQTIKEFGLVTASCRKGAAGNLRCAVGKADTLYFCQTIGQRLVIAGPNYDGSGCKKLTLTLETVPT